MSRYSDVLEDYGGGKLGKAGALKDATLTTTMERYKRLVAKRYRVVDADELELALPKGPLFISTKIDGELWFLIKRGGEVAFCALNGRVLQGVPVAVEAEKQLAGTDDIIIAGELFAIPADGSARPRVSHVGGALGDTTKAERLGFKAFDLLEEKGEDRQGQPYEKRHARLAELFKDGKRSAMVITQVGDAKAAAHHYREWVGSQKFEGVVVRTEQGITFKVKPTFTIDAVVVAFGERITGDVAQVRELTVALRRDDGTLQLLGPVGNGFSEEARVEWHARLKPLEVGSSFRMANREGTLCRFVKPEIVVEVKVHDLIDEGSVDEPVLRMAVKYEEGSGYTSIGLTRFAAMIFPVFVRERTDKQPDVGSIGLEQVHSRLPLDRRDEAAKVLVHEATRVMKRGAYTKITKGLTAVRKYVALETRKAALDPSYPPYVVHFTDYSGGRAEPLKTSIRVASTPEKLDALVKEWIEENIKGGWSEVGAAPAAAEAVAPVKKPAKKAKAADDTAAPAEAPSDAPAPEKAPRKRAAKKPAAEE